MFGGIFLTKLKHFNRFEHIYSDVWVHFVIFATAVTYRSLVKTGGLWFLYSLKNNTTDFCKSNIHVFTTLSTLKLILHWQLCAQMWVTTLSSAVDIALIQFSFWFFPSGGLAALVGAGHPCGRYHRQRGAHDTQPYRADKTRIVRGASHSHHSFWRRWLHCPDHHLQR